MGDASAGRSGCLIDRNGGSTDVPPDRPDASDDRRAKSVSRTMPRTPQFLGDLRASQRTQRPVDTGKSPAKDHLLIRRSWVRAPAAASEVAGKSRVFVLDVIRSERQYVLLGRDARESVARGPHRFAGGSVVGMKRRGPCIQRGLADALQVARRTISTLTDGIVATGFVTRELHPSARPRDAGHVHATRTRDRSGVRRGLPAARASAFDDLRADVLASFDAGLAHVLRQLRSLTTPLHSRPRARSPA